ncbi:MAG TPA: hypothetical protein DDX84_05375 [Nitrospiraceae bacterium]|nr:MAG: hypothetical protein A3D21_08365 [Nitrospirae bacterium RIFCSPHIGHO2_02_FULL_42_12]HBI23624.1 hypothetical protein [Nitrospiraceae bacterium]
MFEAKVAIIILFLEVENISSKALLTSRSEREYPSLKDGHIETDFAGTTEGYNQEGIIHMCILI